MEKVKDLHRVRDSRSEMSRAAEQLEVLQSLAEHVTATLSDMPKGPGVKTPDEVWVKLADAKTYYASAVEKHLQSVASLEQELDRIKSPEVRTAMKLRYVDGKTIEAIGEEMHYSERNIYYLLGKGRREYKSMRPEKGA